VDRDAEALHSGDERRSGHVNVADREWVDRQCAMQPIGTMEQPLEREEAVNVDDRGE
jgi:hypothetical protein